MKVSKFLLMLMTIFIIKPAIEAPKPIAKVMPDLMREMSSVLRNKQSKESLRDPPRLPPKNPLNGEQRAPPRLPPKNPLNEEQRASPRLPPKNPLNGEQRAPPRLPPKNPLNEEQRASPRLPPKNPLNGEQRAPPRLPPKNPLNGEQRASPRLPPKNPLNEEQRAPPRLPPKNPLNEEQRASPRLPPKNPLNEAQRAPSRLPPRKTLNEPPRAPLRVPPQEPLRIPSRQLSSEQSRVFSKEPPSIYIKDAGFMVGIFGKNDHGTFFQGQGVLVEGNRVLTSALTIYSGLTLYVRAYNWPKNVHRYEKQKAFLSDYIERKVKTINTLHDYKIMQILDLAEGFPIEVNTISYLHTSVKDFYQTGHKCVLVALKDKSNDEYDDESEQLLIIKQRKIGSDQLFRPGSCKTQLMSSLREENINRFDKRAWFCGEEFGRKRCGRYRGGAALVCESRDLPNKYFLAGVQVDQDKCEVLFQDTTKASNPIYAELAFGN